MDKFFALVADSQLAVVIAGTPSLGRFALIPLNGPDSAAVIAAESGMVFLGVCGLSRQFVPRSAFAVELSEEQSALIADMFVQLVERVLARMKSTAWLHKLHSIPDLREN